MKQGGRETDREREGAREVHPQNELTEEYSEREKDSQKIHGRTWVCEVSRHQNSVFLGQLDKSKFKRSHKVTFQRQKLSFRTGFLSDPTMTVNN